MTISTLDAALQDLPDNLRHDLLEAFRRIVSNFQERRWEPSELNGGKLCEAVFCIVEGHLSGNYPARASKPANFVKSCQDLERNFPSASRSFRIQIPRMLIALTEVRNNRGVAHVGGDVDPNEMDATVVLYMSKWVVAELVRALHAIPVSEAATLVDAIMERQLPLVWEHGDKRRVLKSILPLRQKVLILLLNQDEIADTTLADWLEQKNMSNLRKRILKPMHSERLIEFDQLKHTVAILPPGVSMAESIVQSL